MLMGRSYAISPDPKLLVLGLTQTCFEGSMYLFVFLWVPFLQEQATGKLPLGYIFSSFMIAMMLGSLFYTSIVTYLSTSSYTNSSADEPVILHAKLSSLVCAVSALTFAIAISSQHEHVRFWAFCAFEACVGMYYPVQGMLRGSLISNEHRATVSILLYRKDNALINRGRISCLPCSVSRSISSSWSPSLQVYHLPDIPYSQYPPAYWVSHPS